MINRKGHSREKSKTAAKTHLSGINKLLDADFLNRLKGKDLALWKTDKAGESLIKNSLGWIAAPDAMAVGLGQIRTFAAEIHKEGFTHAVVLGMGGSSLCCRVFASCFPAQAGFPRLEILDSTHPDSILALESRLDLKRTLFIVSSKSGSTIETNCFLDYFYAKVTQVTQSKAGRQFIAITDSGTSLEKRARERQFRKIFTTPKDIGGRYSVFTFFGLVPAALMGIDVASLLMRTRQAAQELWAQSARNPALLLGAAMADNAKAGRDKLTLLFPPKLVALGPWIQQLVAESTGKDGGGIIPVLPTQVPDGEAYGKDRFFVRLSCKGLPDANPAPTGRAIMNFDLNDIYDLGAHFVTWEIATVACSFLLGILPFGEPDVEAAKERTNAILASLHKEEELLGQKPSFYAGGLAAYCDGRLLKTLRERALKAGPDMPLRDALLAHIKKLGAGNYCVVLAYADESQATRQTLGRLQNFLQNIAGAAPIIIDYGPQYLHSAGQLYKGGANKGLFIELLLPHSRKLPIPGRNFTFNTLCQSQAAGDFAAMLLAKRRVLRLDLGPAGSNSLAAIANALEEPQKLISCQN